MSSMAGLGEAQDRLVVSKRRMTMGILTAALLLLLGRGWVISPPPTPDARAAMPTQQQEMDRIIASLQPAKRWRPLVAIVGINDGTETAGYSMTAER
ncbi:hypothetical protein [Sphingosinicella sp. CPCC 101087]|uniref:hypothetical protein n=1 Tax=Sphingosinicella sp. CPCC 101087 TaxID=2497754 RepID=UPI00101D612A|nr:hypothetical protein [Sphingosinicella sp. CPCC 101087]